MVDTMCGEGTITTPAIVEAFKKTDRGLFMRAVDGGRANTDDEEEDVDDSDGHVYWDMPLREGVRHLSAPSIYATALEALDLGEGLSFLNVGSGTGYLSSIVASLCGPSAIHYGVERRRELIEHSRTKLDALGHTQVQLVHCDCFNLDPEASMRFQRIYVGAGASQPAAALLFRMVCRPPPRAPSPLPPRRAAPPPPGACAFSTAPLAPASLPPAPLCARFPPHTCRFVARPALPLPPTPPAPSLLTAARDRRDHRGSLLCRPRHEPALAARAPSG